jgi:hypothetical protein
MSKTKSTTAKPAATTPKVAAPAVSAPEAATTPPTAYLVTVSRAFLRSRDVNHHVRRRTVGAGTPAAVTYTFSATPVRVPAPLPREIAEDSYLVAVPVVPALKTERLQ